jgi:hypothetical protein
VRANGWDGSKRNQHVLPAAFFQVLVKTRDQGIIGKLFTKPARGWL